MGTCEDFKNNVLPILDEVVENAEGEVIDRDLGKKVYYYDDYDYYYGKKGKGKGKGKAGYYYDDYYYGKKGKGKGKGKGKAGYYYDDYYYRRDLKELENVQDNDREVVEE